MAYKKSIIAAMSLLLLAACVTPKILTTDEDQRYSISEKERAAIRSRAESLLHTNDVSVVLKADFTGRGHTEYLIVGHKDSALSESESNHPPGPGNTYLVTNSSGAILVLIGETSNDLRIVRDAQGVLYDKIPLKNLQVGLPSPGVLGITWKITMDNSCRMELHFQEALNRYQATPPVCTDRR